MTIPPDAVAPPGALAAADHLDVTRGPRQIADSLAAKTPFVVTFATPAYCQTRTCGPVVDIVSEVRRRYESGGIRFIHVEIYEDNDPAKGTNRWVNEWKLPSEPWTFLVGADGRIKERFEGTFSVRELDEAVQQHLL